MAHLPQIESTTKLPRVDRSRQTPPKPGSYSAGPAEQATNRTQAWPESTSPGPNGRTNQVTSANAGPSGPFQSDRSSWPEWLKPPRTSDTSGRFFRG